MPDRPTQLKLPLCLSKLFSSLFLALNLRHHFSLQNFPLVVEPLALKSLRSLIFDLRAHETLVDQLAHLPLEVVLVCLFQLGLHSLQLLTPLKGVDKLLLSRLREPLLAKGSLLLKSQSFVLLDKLLCVSLLLNSELIIELLDICLKVAAAPDVSVDPLLVNLLLSESLPMLVRFL